MHPNRSLATDTRTAIAVALRSDPSRPDLPRIKAAIAACEGAIAGPCERTKPSPLLLSQADAASLLNVSRWTIRRLRANRKLVPVNVGGLIRYRTRDVEELLSKAPAAEVRS